MELKALVTAANATGAKLKIRENADSTFSLLCDFKDYFTECTTRDNKVRTWRKLDTLHRHLRNEGFRGVAYMVFTNQTSLV